MHRSHFKILNRVQDHVSGVALRAKTEGGLRGTTAVIVNYFFATLRPHSFKRIPSFEDWPPRSNEEIGPERRF